MNIYKYMYLYINLIEIYIIFYIIFRRCTNLTNFIFFFFFFFLKDYYEQVIQLTEEYIQKLIENDQNISNLPDTTTLMEVFFFIYIFFFYFSFFFLFFFLIFSFLFLFIIFSDLFFLKKK